MTALRSRTLDFTIANGTSLSGALRLNGLHVEAIVMPATWSAAGLSFAASETEGGTYLPLVDALGVEITLTVAAGRRIAMPMGTLYGHDWLQLRSGTSAAAVLQGGTRTVTLLCRDYA